MWFWEPKKLTKKQQYFLHILLITTGVHILILLFHMVSSKKNYTITLHRTGTGHVPMRFNSKKTVPRVAPKPQPSQQATLPEQKETNQALQQKPEVKKKKAPLVKAETKAEKKETPKPVTEKQVIEKKTAKAIPVKKVEPAKPQPSEKKEKVTQAIKKEPAPKAKAEVKKVESIKKPEVKEQQKKQESEVKNLPELKVEQIVPAVVASSLPIATVPLSAVDVVDTPAEGWIQEMQSAMVNQLTEFHGLEEQESLTITISLDAKGVPSIITEQGCTTAVVCIPRRKVLLEYSYPKHLWGKTVAFTF